MDNHNIEVMTSSASNDWSTPQSFVDALPFDFELDVCATEFNTKCKRWISPEQDALAHPWRKGVCFGNFPYGRSIGDWIEKAYQESKKGCLVVCLVPNRTETNWFSRIWSDASLICFLGRRIKFLHPNRNKEKNGAPFANVIAVFGSLAHIDPISEHFMKRAKDPLLVPNVEVIAAAEFGAAKVYAQELAKIGTVIVPGAGNIWLHEEGSK